MGNRSADPLRLDVGAFARDAGRLEGRWPVASLQRLASLLASPEADDLTWRAEGQHRAVTGADDELWLHLRAEAVVQLTCQRCLLPLPASLAVDRRIRFARDEAQAEALDAELEEDVMALSRALDLRELVEDELLLALPLVPRHERCPDGALPALPDEPADTPAASPFAALAVLKKGEGAR